MSHDLIALPNREGLMEGQQIPVVLCRLVYSIFLLLVYWYNFEGVNIIKKISFDAIIKIWTLKSNRQNYHPKWGKTQFYLQFLYVYIIFIPNQLRWYRYFWYFYRNDIIWEQPVQKDSTLLFFPIVRCFFFRFIHRKLSPYKKDLWFNRDPGALSVVIDTWGCSNLLPVTEMDRVDGRRSRLVWYLIFVSPVSVLAGEWMYFDWNP